MNDVELAFAGIARQAELLATREVSSAELVDLYLARIERINPELNAFVEVLSERARAEAQEADRRIAAGERAPLLGVPVALKDELDDVEGLVTSNGTRAFDRPASADAEHVRRLRAAGAVLLAKTTLPELAIVGYTETEAFGITRNPWETSRSPGGSSGGSAAAVAAGLVGAASGSDGAGSIRIPAASCGLFGLKPQRGRISLAPLEEHWLGMTVSGCLARRVADVALWMDVAADEPEWGTFSEAAAKPAGSLRIAVTTSAPRAVAPPLLAEPVDRAVEQVAEKLDSLGHRVEARDPAWGFIGSDVANRYLAAIEEEVGRVPNPERLEAQTRGFATLGRMTPGLLKRLARSREAKRSAKVNRIFEDFDVLLMPTMGEPAIEVGRWAGKGALRTLIPMSRTYAYTPVWNHTGQPAAAVPAGFAGDLPLSVQLVAPPGREDVLLSLSSQLEAASGWTEERPALAV